MKPTAILLLIAAAVAAAAFRPAAGAAATFNGVVVATQHGKVLVATPAGSLRSLRAQARLGARLAVRGGDVAVVGRSGTARIRGIVVRRLGSTLVLSSHRNLIAIPNRDGRRLAAVAPAPGSIVDTRVSIVRGEIEEEDEHELGRVEAGTIAVQATIAAVGPGTVTLDVQGRLLTVSLPGGLTLPASVVGQTVTITLAVARDDDDQAEDEDRDDDDGGHGGHSGPGHGGGGDG